MIARASLQVMGVLLILLIVFGPPNDVGTVVGLAAAGLSVALKDFIVGFLGWFVLMGKNGIRVGDQVEINGVTGEVVEIGMFYTVLLETGAWSESNPTGRRVTFNNSFAIEGHYFNFSTSGPLDVGRSPHPGRAGPRPARHRRGSPGADRGSDGRERASGRRGMEGSAPVAACVGDRGRAVDQHSAGVERFRDHRALHHTGFRARRAPRPSLPDGDRAALGERLGTEVRRRRVAVGRADALIGALGATIGLAKPGQSLRLSTGVI